jgi:hypothetical protein
MADIAAKAQHALAEDNPALADNLCRAAIVGDTENGALWAALAEVARKIGAHQHAIRYYAQAARLSPGNTGLVDGFDRAVAEAAAIRRRRLEQPPPPRGVLLVREVGGHFWTEIFHVLTAALIAEETDRELVIHWGPRCQFPEAAGEDAFGAVLVPIANRRVADLQIDPDSVFPASWAGLAALDAPPDGGPKCHLPALLFRDEETVVSDSWGWPLEVMSWTTSDDTVSSDHIVATLRRLFRTYVIPRPEILQAADRTWTEIGAEAPMLAVHVPVAGGAKAAANLKAQEGTCQANIDRLISSAPEIRILMLSDNDDILTLYRNRYGGRLLSVPIATPSHSATQALVAALLASRCDYFVSNGVSNIAMAVYCMKDWGDDRALLVGPNMYLNRPGPGQAPKAPPTPAPATVTGKIRPRRRSG